MLRPSILLGAVLLLGTMSAHSQSAEGGARGFEAADANQDGVVTREEYRAAREKAFSRIDRNGDGYLDDKDLPQRRMARRKAGERLKQLRTQFDTNRDGRVDKAEFISGPMPAFDRADTDGNGELSAQEMQAARQAVQQRAGRR